MKKTLSHPATAAAIATAALIIQFATWQVNQTRKAEVAQASWQVSIETRLARLETKMDQLLAVTDHAIKIARERLPQERPNK